MFILEAAFSILNKERSRRDGTIALRPSGCMYTLRGCTSGVTQLLAGITSGVPRPGALPAPPASLRPNPPTFPVRRRDRGAGKTQKGFGGCPQRFGPVPDPGAAAQPLPSLPPPAAAPALSPDRRGRACRRFTPRPAAPSSPGRAAAGERWGPPPPWCWSRWWRIC